MTGNRALWHEYAACVDMDPELFFPGRGDNTATIAHAKTICNRCPVRAACLHHALTHTEQHGIWGGTTPKERRQIRRRQRQDAA